MMKTEMEEKKMNHYEIGTIVTGIYKTGKYIGEITLEKPDQCLIRVLAVLKHPQQGDLHNPKMVDVPFFHERRALAYREQVYIPKTYVKHYEGDIPPYVESLKKAVTEYKMKLNEEDSEWANLSIEKLNTLENDYFK